MKRKQSCKRQQWVHQNQTNKWMRMLILAQNKKEQQIPGSPK